MLFKFLLKVKSKINLVARLA